MKNRTFFLRTILKYGKIPKIYNNSFNNNIYDTIQHVNQSEHSNKNNKKDKNVHDGIKW